MQKIVNALSTNVDDVPVENKSICKLLKIERPVWTTCDVRWFLFNYFYFLNKNSGFGNERKKSVSENKMISE